MLHEKKKKETMVQILENIATCGRPTLSIFKLLPSLVNLLISLEGLAGAGAGTLMGGGDFAGPLGVIALAPSGAGVDRCIGVPAVSLLWLKKESRRILLPLSVASPETPIMRI